MLTSKIEFWLTIVSLTCFVDVHDQGENCWKTQGHTPQDILTLLPTQGPIGISIDMDEKFSLLEDNVRK